MPTRREFIGGAIGAAACAAMPEILNAQTAAVSAAPLNLMIVTADDLNGDSMGWMGSKVGATPNLDAFAATAHCFAHCHGAAPICQPSREAIMTGRVPHRSGALGFDPVNRDVPTLWESVKSAGYFTAGINKLMHMEPTDKFNWDYRSDGGKRKPETGRDPKQYHAHVSESIRLASEKKQPFFINVNMNDPHRPFYGTPQDKELGGVAIDELKEDQITIPPFLDDLPEIRKEVTQYFNSVRRCDQSFSNIMKALDESGQRDRTVVVFIADHGMSFPFSKTTIYQNGTHTPMLIRAPGVTQPQVDREHVVSNTDLMPTVLELLGLKSPEGMDGRRLTGILRGGALASPWPDHVFTHVNTNVRHDSFPSRCVRTKTSSYIFNAWPDGKTQFRSESMGGLSFPAMRAAGNKDPKIAERVKMLLFRAPEEFYDLSNDPGERANMIKAGEHRDEIRRLKSLLLAQMKATNDPLLKDFSGVAET